MVIHGAANHNRVVDRTIEELRAATATALKVCVEPRQDDHDEFGRIIDLDSGQLSTNIRREHTDELTKPRYRHRPRFKI